jgi:hypothetical protein
MKKYIFTLIFVIMNINLIYSQINTTTEVLFFNIPGGPFKVQCYPISMVMNGSGYYNLLSFHPTDVSGKIFDYNNGLYYGNNIFHYALYIPKHVEDADPPVNYGLNNDYTDGEGMAVGSIGPGIYKFVINIYDSLIIENDGGPTRDISIYGRSDGIYYKINDNYGYEVKIDYDLPETYHIKLWNPYPNNPNYPYARTKILNYYTLTENRSFKYSNLTQTPTNPYNIIPIDPRQNCNQFAITNHIDQNSFYPDSTLIILDAIEERHGTLTLNLDIEKDLTTPTSFFF